MTVFAWMGFTTLNGRPRAAPEVRAHFYSRGNSGSTNVSQWHSPLSSCHRHGELLATWAATYSGKAPSVPDRYYGSCRYQPPA